ncbi:uncharacterized protein LOC141692356 [Apium graveolens]|uniref:uncharacterized protein LOC141692356 n=1 Tax=Apium graveolens TaxID=4045 RepID=UPI003D7BFBB9
MDDVFSNGFERDVWTFLFAGKIISSPNPTISVDVDMDASTKSPTEDAPESEKEYSKRWIKADAISRCYVLAAISDVLQYQSMVTATNILFNIKKLFGDQNIATRQFCLNYNMNKRLYSFAELLTDLHAAEGLFRQSVQVNPVEKDSSSKLKVTKKKKKAQTQKVVKEVRV